MSAEDRPSRDAVAGVRLADGRLAFVGGVPSDLRAGTPVWVRLGEGEQPATIHIPPALLFWCDPAAPLGEFLGADTTAPIVAGTAAGPAPADGDWLLAPEGAPDAACRAAMLDLARSELARLDDQVAGPVRGQGCD